MLEIKTAAELINAELEGRWAARRADRQSALMQYILRAFVARGGPIPVDQIVAEFPAESSRAVGESLAQLDERDLIQLRDGRVEIAYPFSATPTPFVARLAGGRERHACCAVDALAMAPMLGEAVDVRGRCHHCGDPLALAVEPDGPGPGAEGIMVWIGTRADGDCRLATGF